MTKRADSVAPFAMWPSWPMPPEVCRKGPWGQLNAWNHPGLRGQVKQYASSADVWIHANGMAYFMQYGSWHATVTFPGPACTCSDASEPCIHLLLADVLRGLP